MEQGISKELEEVIEKKKKFIQDKENDELSIPISKHENKKKRVFHSQVIYPIVSDGDSVGSVVLMSKEA